jgi:PAS fold
MGSNMTRTALRQEQPGAFPRGAGRDSPVAQVAQHAPGTMRLNAVREAGRIVDFRWQAANATAARLMRRQPHELCGNGLLDVIAGPMDHPALIDLYRRVVEHGNAHSFAQVHRVDGWHDVVLHHVVRSGDGVAVTLTNQSALRRELAVGTGLRPEDGKPQ